MRLQTSTRLAILAVLELTAREGRQLSVAEIGEKYNVSNHHLAKVMNVMGRAGLVRSVRGAGGGYQFVGNARRITLLDVAQLFEDLSSSELNAQATDTTLEGQTLCEVGSITLGTMRKLVDRHSINDGWRPNPTMSRRRNQPRL
jgi:Rrf2 family protein